MQVALGRILGGVFGGFVPLAQSCVADLCDVESRPKFLGRVQVGEPPAYPYAPALPPFGGNNCYDGGVLRRRFIVSYWFDDLVCYRLAWGVDSY